MVLSETKKKRMAEWRKKKMVLFNKYFLLNLSGEMDPLVCGLPKFILYVNDDLARS